MYIDPITRQIFIYGTPKSCDNNPQKVIALDLDGSEHYVLTYKHVLLFTLLLFEPEQVQSAVSPNTFTAQEARDFSNAELTLFWNPVLFTEQTDTTLKPFGNASFCDFLVTSGKDSIAFYSTPIRYRFNLYNVFRIDLHDHFLNIAPLFAPDWFADAFIASFGFSC